MPRKRLGLAQNTDIESFSGPSLTTLGDYAHNVMFAQTAAGAIYAMQRPPINTIYDASVYSLTSGKGRGIYYWTKAGYNGLFMVHDSSVYKDSYATAAIGTITTGTSKIYINELGSYLTFIDPEANRGWSWDGTTFAEITDAQFPSKNGLALAHGNVVLDGTMYVLDTAGTLWGSDVDSPTSYTATNFIGASKLPDAGVAACLHKDNILVFGTQSVQAFYNAANPYGSPLAGRTDLYYPIGCASAETVATEGEMVFWVGANQSGGISAYSMDNWQVKVIGTLSINAYLAEIMQNSVSALMGEAFTARGHVFYAITVYTSISGARDPEVTLVYDATADTWATWEHASSAVDYLPIIGWTAASLESAGRGILLNGDVISVLDTFSAYDATALGDGYFEEALQVIGNANLTFTAGTLDVQRVSGTLPSLLGFSTGDEVDVTNTSLNNTSFIVNGNSTYADLNFVAAPTTEATTSAIISRDSYIDEDYYESTTDGGDAIPFEVRIAHLDEGSVANKIIDHISIVCDESESSQPLSISVAKGNHATFATARTVDIQSQYNKVSGFGTAKRWTIKLTGAPTEVVRLYGIDLVYRELV